uniref:MD-2-related lipid-recognition domain-containing protein n=1 Tax=Anopheles funestus TaxID=62324 RepID=A0A4Y0BQL7_ANOFN
MTGFWIIILLYYCSATVCCIKINFESIEQTFGEDFMVCDVRVRKFNRTSSVLNGTFYVLHDTTNDVKYQVDMYYSRLGNQQYNYMPMKLPSAGICAFVNNLHSSFPEIAAIFVNFPGVNECPITAREIHVLDQEFPSTMWPVVMQKTGLWKLDIIGVLRKTSHLALNIVLRATND